MNKTLRYGIIGCGSFGNTHIESLITIDGADIIALCDKHIEKCYEAKEKFSLDVECYDDYEKMLAEKTFDIVVVATSDKEHAPISIAALNAGNHVMSEKPMSLLLDECKAMIEASEKSGKLLMVGQVCRFAPAFVKAKSIIDSGLIGELYFVESEYAHDYKEISGVDGWRMDKDREPIIGGACHAIDLLRWFAGDPTETMAYSNHKVLTDWPVNDTTVAIMKFPRDVIGKVFTSIGCKREYTMRTVVYGTKGTIVVDNTSPTLTLTLDKSVTNGHFAEGFFTKGSEGSIRHLIEVEINNHNVPAEHKAMREAVIDNKPLLMTGREGAKTVAVCRAVVEAAKSGTAVKIEYDF